MPTAGAIGGQRRVGSLGQRVLERGVDGEHLVEAADGEDLGHHALQCGHAQAGLRRAHLLRGDHQHAQAHAADVVDAGEIQHQRAAAFGSAGHQRQQRGLEIGRAAVIDAARGCDHEGVGKLLRGDVHGATLVVRHRPGEAWISV
jgi:hypothetical protein